MIVSRRTDPIHLERLGRSHLLQVACNHLLQPIEGGRKSSSYGPREQGRYAMDF